MPLQIRRGTTAQISGITPLIGELIYDTQLKKVIVGDGTTAGGISSNGISFEEAKDASAASLLAGTHDGLSFFYDSTAKELSASLNINSDLNLNGFNIISDLDSNINITASGTGVLVFQGLTINSAGNIRKPSQLNISPLQFLSVGSAPENIPGNIFVTRDTYSTAFTDGFTFAQYHNTADAVDFKFYRTRGSTNLPGDLIIGDSIADIVFLGKSPDSIIPATGASLSVIVDGNSTQGQIPVKFQFSISNGVSIGPRAELSSTGIWKVDQIEGLNSSLIVNGNVNGNLNGNVSGNVNGDLKGSVFADDSTLLVDATSGTIPYSVLSGAPVIPTNVSELNNDAGYISSLPGSITTDIIGSVFADDSTLLVDATSGTIPYSVLSGAPVIPTNVSELINDAGYLSSLPGSITTDIIGSVFADDSTLLVDATSGTIPYSVLSGAPVIPTNVSELNNDAGYISSLPGSITTDIIGSVFADDSSKIIDGTDGRITSPSVTISDFLQLPGGTLVNSAGNIRKTTPGPISIAPSSFVAFGSAGENISGNIFITRSNYSTSSNEGFTFAQHHNTADAVDFRFFRTRGTALSQTAVTINDIIADIVFLGLSPGSPAAAAGATLSVIVDDTPVLGQIPVKFQFNTSNGVSIGPRAELSSTGVWKVDQIEGLNSSLNVIGDFKGSIFADDSSKIIDGTDGRITAPSVTISSFLQLPVYDNDTARDAAIPFPNKGMVIMVENRDDSTEDSTVLNKLQFYNGTNWVDL